VKLFYKNPNLKKLSIVCLTQFISSMPLIAFFDSVLIKNVSNKWDTSLTNSQGFHKETFANISSVLFPIEIIVSIVIVSLDWNNKFWINLGENM